MGRDSDRDDDFIAGAGFGWGNAQTPGSNPQMPGGPQIYNGNSQTSGVGDQYTNLGGGRVHQAYSPQGATLKPVERAARHGIGPIKSIDFEDANFDVPYNWYKSRLRLKGVPAPRILELGDAQKILDVFGTNSESAADVAQIRTSKSGHTTFLFRDGQEAQEVKSKDGKTSRLRFRYDEVHQAHARMLMESLEKNGELIDYKKIELKGTTNGVRSMKFALQEEHDRRYADIQNNMVGWGNYNFKHFSDQKDMGVFDSNLKQAKREVQAKADLIDQITGVVMKGHLDNRTVSALYQMVGAGQKRPGTGLEEPDWNKVAMLVGVRHPDQPNPGFAPLAPGAPGPQPRA